MNEWERTHLSFAFKFSKILDELSEIGPGTLGTRNKEVWMCLTFFLVGFQCSSDTKTNGSEDEQWGNNVVKDSFLCLGTLQEHKYFFLHFAPLSRHFPKQINKIKKIKRNSISLTNQGTSNYAISQSFAKELQV